MADLKYYLYNNIPGAWTGWTLAVLAVSQVDADRYVKSYNGGGKRVGIVDQPGAEVKADCGAITSAAEAIVKAGVYV